MNNPEKIDTLKRVISYLQSFDFSTEDSEQYDELRNTLENIVPDINIQQIEKNEVMRCRIMSDALEIKVFSNSGGKRTNNLHRALRRFCQQVCENYNNLAQKDLSIKSQNDIEISRIHSALTSPSEQPGGYDKRRFGEQPIPNRIRDVYQQAISKFFGDVTLLTSDEISALKGMCNRCVKHDQSDWRTTYSMIGSPERAVLKQYVDEIVAIRDDIRVGNYSNVIAFRDKYYDIFINTYDALCGSPTEEKEEPLCCQIDNDEVDENFTKYENRVYDETDESVYEQIDKIEAFVHSCPPDKENGKYSKRRCRNIMHKMLNNGLIPNLAIRQRGTEYIAWITEIDLIGSSKKSNVDAIDNLGRKLILAIRRQGLKSFVNTTGQYSSVLFGEDTTYMTSEEKYSAIMEVVLEATSQGTHFVAGSCTSAIKRLYDLNLVNSPVEYYSRNGSYIAKIPGINLEGITNSSGSVTHRQNAAKKDLIKEMVINHERGILIDLIDSALLSGSIEAINEDWLLSRDYEPEEENNKEIINENVQSSTKNEIKTTTTNSRINSSVNLSKLDFSFEEKDDDDDFNF